jgi:hypothetical protein
MEVVDASGGTDVDGNVVEIGSHDPLEDVLFFFEELNEWVCGIIRRNKRKLERKAKLEGAKTERLLSEQLAGVGINEVQVKAAISESDLSNDMKSWSPEDLKKLSSAILKKSKKMIIAANKMDIAPKENIIKLKEIEGKGDGEGEGESKDKNKNKNGNVVIPCSAEAELALRAAAKNEFIKYLPGDADFEISHKISEKQKGWWEWNSGYSKSCRIRSVRLYRCVSSGG